MEVIENTLDVEIDVFLDRPLFCFLGTTDSGMPRVTPLWFLWEDGAVWIIGDEQKTYPHRIRENPAVDLAIVDFDRTTGTVQHVGMRGTASVESLDPGRAERLLSRYLGPEKDEWDKPFFGDPYEWGDEMILIRVEPKTVVARDQSYSPAPTLNDR